MAEACEFRTRFAQIQISHATGLCGYRTTNNQTLSLFHSTPLLTHEFAENASLYFPEAINGFREQIVIDLGAGKTADGYLLARDLRARAYIGVDFCFAPSLIESVDNLPPSEKTIDYSIIYDSIENLLPALPPLSCSFISAGIDDAFPGFDELLKSMEIHLPRTVHPDGACLLFSHNSKDFSFPNLSNISSIGSISTWTHPQGEQG